MKENKLIAEFMGYSPVSGVYVSRKDEFHIDEMQYDISWDWLMPVVEKIEDEGYSFERNKQEDGDWQCLITKGYDIVHQKFSDCSREATYQAVVEFIKEYNKQNN